jgi:hypothetical protein
VPEEVEDPPTPIRLLPIISVGRRNPYEHPTREVERFCLNPDAVVDSTRSTVFYLIC